MQPHPPRTRLLSTRAAAAYLGLQPQTLRRWRMHGTGPTYIRLGNHARARVGYRERDLVGWLEAHAFSSTAAETS